MLRVENGFLRSFKNPNVFQSFPPSHQKRAVVVKALPSTNEAKTLLRDLSARVERGVLATPSLRGEIEEAQVALENRFDCQIDFEKLEGRWRMIYTDTRDVLPVLFFGKPPFLNDSIPWPVNVGAIFQEFSSREEGLSKNIIKFGVDNIFEEEGITFTVFTKYEVRSPQRIALTFDRVQVGDLKIAPPVETLLAPALLPRTGFNHQLLLAIREFAFSVPLPQLPSQANDVFETAGYLLTYLDDDMLIGRPLDVAGTFIFNREIEM